MKREEKRREENGRRCVWGTPAGNGQRQRQFKLRTFVNERRQEPREMKSVQDTGGRWTLHGLDASARVRRIARTRTDGTHKTQSEEIRKSRGEESRTNVEERRSIEYSSSGARSRMRETVQDVEH